MSKKVSLKQFLMKTGRHQNSSECIVEIRNGKITINNKIIDNPNYFFNPKKSIIKYNNEKLKKISNIYFIMNKPAGYLSQKSTGEKTVYDLFENLDISKESKNSLYAVGRLDKYTEGLLIITNDGELSNLIMSPENMIIKKYYALLEKSADINKIKLLEKGMEIEIDRGKYKTKPCNVKIVGEKEIYISISEGKKRQIRKMFEKIDNKVVYLKRVSIGGLQLGKLAVGEIKAISRDDIYGKLDTQ